MVLIALGAVLLFGMAALVLDGGLNFVDRRHLQLAADAGALAGASSIGLSTSNAALDTAQSYTWENLSLPVPAGCVTTTVTNSQGTGSRKTCIDATSGYTVVSIYPDVTQTAAHPTFPPEDTVGVDITHSKQQTGLSAIFGGQNCGASNPPPATCVTIATHAAAEAQPGTRNFPYALATRFLKVQGNGNVAAFGASLIGACSGDGSGAFKGNGGANGGIQLIGSSEIDLGAGASDNTATTYTSPQALLLADPNSVTTCQGKSSSNANNDGSAGWGPMGSNVKFVADAMEYNTFWAFNAGPTTCSITNPTPATCESNYYGDANWMDNCWKSGGTDVPVKTGAPVSTSSPPNVPNFVDQSTGTIYPTPADTLQTCTPGKAKPPNASFEGSYPYSQFPGFPPYASPSVLVNTLGYTIPSSGSPGGAVLPCTSAAIVPTVAGGGGFRYTSLASSGCSNADLTFAPGWYVFEGAFTLSPHTLTCSGAGLPQLAGCAFIFRNGASFDMGGQNNQLNCATVGSTKGCSFEFQDTGTAVSPGNYMDLSQKMDVNLTPIPYTQNSTTFKFPIIYSNQATDCLDTNGKCAVSFSQPGTFNMAGTVFVPHGILDIGSNVSAVTGQLIADTIQIQAGSSATPSGVAYRGNQSAPVPGAAVLVE